MSVEPDYDTIDPGVRRLVRYVRGWGIPTSDSGDGVSKSAEWYESGEALRVPHVFAMERGFELFPNWVRIAVAMRTVLVGDRVPRHGQEITVSYNGVDDSLLFAVYGFTDEDVPAKCDSWHGVGCRFHNTGCDGDCDCAGEAP